MKDDTNEVLECGFCSNKESDTVNIYVGNNGGKICNNCIIGSYAVIKNRTNIPKELASIIENKDKDKDNTDSENLLKTKEIESLIDH